MSGLFPTARRDMSGASDTSDIESVRFLKRTTFRLAEAVDEYIGETEKNLVRVFDGVKGSDSVLLFDEAKRLFVP